MKPIIMLFMIFQFALLGCKQDVKFGHAESTEFSSEEPKEPITNVGPVVKILQAPSDHKLDKETSVVFEVVKGDFEIDEVQCFVNNILISCDWVKGVVEFFDMPLGLQWFEVVATDVKGLVGRAKESWNVFDKYKKAKDKLKVAKGDNKTDILFVIDNSASMKNEQKYISERFNNFINQVMDVDWHIGITTTDTRSSEEWTDGQLDRFANNDYFLTPALGKQKAQELFAENVQRKENGTDVEKGMQATYRSIQRSLQANTEVDKALADFFRPDAALAVVVVSDEDESGGGSLTITKKLLELVKNTWGSSKIFQFNSIITYTEKCLSGQGATMGYKYAALSRQTNGMIGDICSKNYSQLLKDLGQGVANLQKVHKLSCVPQDIDNDSKVELLIVPKNGKKLPGYTIDKETITFDRALKPGDYEFHYFCLAK